MKILLSALALALMASPALARKDCEELKGEIAAKLDARGVQTYTLDIVSKGRGHAAVVGSCEGGTKEITYQRGAHAGHAAHAAPAASAPQ